MITIEDIMTNSKPHPVGQGKTTRIMNDKVTISIVGGAPSLYGDFEKTFEFAVIDNSTKEFVTDYLCEKSSSDIVAYMGEEDLLKYCNVIMKNDFQFL